MPTMPPLVHLTVTGSYRIDYKPSCKSFLGRVGKGTASQAAEKVDVARDFGGAAVYRCGKCFVLNLVLSAEGEVLD